MSPSTAFRFASDFRQRLNQLLDDLLRGGGVGGEAGRRGRMPGNVAFRDHRSYVPGDDMRFLDWNVFMRSGALVVKTFTHDEAPEAVVVLDRSASMGPVGSRQDRLAREIAAAFGFLAMRTGGDAVLRCSGGGTLGGDRPMRGPRSLDAWLQSVENAPDPRGAGPGDLSRLAAPTRPGRVVAWVSDFLFEAPPAAALAALARSASLRFAFLVLAHDDALAPARAGDALALADAEGPGRVVARNDPAWRAAFEDVRAEHVATTSALASRHQFVTAVATGDATFEDVLLRALGRSS